jgi:ubiquinone biosynthesis protein COQ4
MGRLFKLWQNLGSIYAAIMLSRRPDQVKYVFMIGNRQDNLTEAARAAGEIADPFEEAALQALWEQRYHPPRYDLHELARLPEHTLGGAYARFMLANGLKPDFYENVQARHKMHYLRLRLRQTHDIWHVLSGYDTGLFGEVGLQAFYFAQVTNGQSALIFGGTVIKSLLRGRFDDLERYVAHFCEGYRNGRRAHTLLAVRWESFWNDDLDTLRQRHGITPAQPGGGVW